MIADLPGETEEKLRNSARHPVLGQILVCLLRIEACHGLTMSLCYSRYCHSYIEWYVFNTVTFKPAVHKENLSRTKGQYQGRLCVRHVCKTERGVAVQKN
jgi:hypothetical protein